MKKYLLAPWILSFLVLAIAACGGNSSDSSSNLGTWSKAYSGIPLFPYSVSSLKRLNGGDLMVTGIAPEVVPPDSALSFDANPVSGDKFSTAPQHDALLLKLGNDGALAWGKRFNEGVFDFVIDVEEDEHGYIIGGTLVAADDAWVSRLSQEGEVEWLFGYGGPNSESAPKISKADDGGYVVAASSSSFGQGGQDVWVFKIDSSGNIEWQRAYVTSLHDTVLDVQSTLSGGFLLGGYSEELGGLGSITWLMELDRDGGILWTEAFQEDEGYYFSTFRETSDGGFILSGGKYSDGMFDGSWIMKLTVDGTIDWRKFFEGHSLGILSSNQETEDNSILLGESLAGSQILLNLDGDGNIVWQKQFALSAETYISQFQSDGDGYLFGGTQGEQLLLLRLSEDGAIEGCSEVGIVPSSGIIGQDQEVLSVPIQFDVVETGVVPGPTNMVVSDVVLGEAGECAL